jgi:hypothetical protein
MIGAILAARLMTVRFAAHKLNPEPENWLQS